ncbi:MAG: hypothetical protein H0T89_07415 [Deltaproteobacteria bacterium]|nr:hypothetical protein [Deltaproteobacteria bacterium]MDQ3297055.1 hypothetical protein [Myxococcota bacterium]
MRKLICLLSILVPSIVTSVALAQPGGAPPPPPPPGYGPQPAYGQAPNNKHGMTFEANIGLGLLWFSADGESSDKETSLGGLNLGVGGWINPKLAITLRVAGVTYTEDIEGETARLTAGFVGPSAQYWVSENAWVGGGLGLGFLQASFAGESESETGLGLDLRAGYTFSTTSESTWNLSFELTPSSIEFQNTDVTVWGAAVLFGYQHL